MLRYRRPLSAAILETLRVEWWNSSPRFVFLPNRANENNVGWEPNIQPSRLWAHAVPLLHHDLLFIQYLLKKKWETEIGKCYNGF